MPGTGVLPARAEASLRGAFPGSHPARRRGPAGTGGGDIGAAPLVTTDPDIAARHLLVLADGRELQPPENMTPLVRGDVITGYGPGLVAVFNATPAPSGAGTPRALDGRVELAGQDPGLAAASRLRAHELIPAGGGVQ